jgi:hypothetical protein
MPVRGWQPEKVFTLIAKARTGKDQPEKWKAAEERISTGTCGKEIQVNLTDKA